LNNYCFWADEAYEAVIENNQCTGWKTEPKSLCLNINYTQVPVFNVNRELQVLIIKQISTPENTKVVNWYYSGEYGTTYIKANGDNAWSDCILEEQNPICNCPEQ
jgi:thymidylate synthase